MENMAFSSRFTFHASRFIGEANIMIENNEEKTQATDVGVTQMVVEPTGEATQMAISITCPVCGTVNTGGDQYCADCGFLLSSALTDEGELKPDEDLGDMPKLVDASSGREFALNPGVNTVGRQDADVLLSHPTVSRSHAKLTVADGIFTLEDTGSTNGTFLDGAKVEPGQPVEINDGAEITFGSVALRLSIPKPEDASEAEEVEEVEKEQQEEPVTEEQSEEEPMASPAAEEEEPTEPVEAQEELPTLAYLKFDDGIEFPIRQGENTLGRRPSNSIVIQDAYASGSHAVITAEDDKFTITDVGSTNGTLVNGERLAPNEPRELSDGDEITFGQSVFRFTI
jgi:pSer/pThr/pTyr-binding forkhead associated (FHA) protein